uniref:uncharacterized protein n=1 Tax=Semicossyphus pulcher TaxID=241346 RepID=UPI0037E8F3C7
MSEFKWIQTSLFLFALLQFPAAAETEFIPLTVRAGGQVTLSCENVIKDQENCRSTAWLFGGSGGNAAEALFENGKIHRDSEAKKDRLSVTANCSLVIKKVTEEDVGSYTCRQFSESGGQIGEDTGVYLSVTRLCRDRSGLDIIMLVLRVAELLLITVVTVLLFRARGNQGARDDDKVHHDGDDGVNYEDVGEPSASVRLH